MYHLFIYIAVFSIGLTALVSIYSHDIFSADQRAQDQGRIEQELAGYQQGLRAFFQDHPGDVDCSKVEEIFHNENHYVWRQPADFEAAWTVDCQNASGTPVQVTLSRTAQNAREEQILSAMARHSPERSYDVSTQTMAQHFYGHHLRWPMIRDNAYTSSGFQILHAEQIQKLNQDLLPSGSWPSGGHVIDPYDSEYGIDALSDYGRSHIVRYTVKVKLKDSALGALPDDESIYATVYLEEADSGAVRNSDSVLLGHRKSVSEESSAPGNSGKLNGGPPGNSGNGGPPHQADRMFNISDVRNITLSAAFNRNERHQLRIEGNPDIPRNYIDMTVETLQVRPY